jgi:hypothetical protein
MKNVEYNFVDYDIRANDTLCRMRHFVQYDSRDNMNFNDDYYKLKLFTLKMCTFKCNLTQYHIFEIVSYST